MKVATESREIGGTENIQPAKWDQSAAEKVQLKNKWPYDSRPQEHREHDARTVIPHEISLSRVGNRANTDIQDTKESRGTSSLNQNRLYHGTVGYLSLTRSQVAFEEKLLEKDQLPLRQRNESFPRESDGFCIVERTT